MPTYKIEELCSRTYTELREEMDKEFPNALAKDLNEKNMTDYQLALFAAYCRVNCFSDHNTLSSYDNRIIGHVLPELLKRFKTQK